MKELLWEKKISNDPEDEPILGELGDEPPPQCRLEYFFDEEKGILRRIMVCKDDEGIRTYYGR